WRGAWLAAHSWFRPLRFAGFALLRLRLDHDADAAIAPGHRRVGGLALHALRLDVVHQLAAGDLVAAIRQPGVVAEAHGAVHGFVVDGRRAPARGGAVLAQLLEFRRRASDGGARYQVVAKPD